MWKKPEFTSSPNLRVFTVVGIVPLVLARSRVVVAVTVLISGIDPLLLMPLLVILNEDSVTMKPFVTVAAKLLMKKLSAIYRSPEFSWISA